MITYLVLLIILIPTLFFIYKITAKAWKKVELEEKDECINNKIREELEKDPAVQDEIDSATMAHKHRQAVKQMGNSSGGNIND